MKTFSSRSIQLSSCEVSFLENELNKQVSRHQEKLKLAIENKDYELALTLSSRLELMTSLWIKLLDS